MPAGGFGMKLTETEERELAILQEYKLSKSRWMSQAEQDRYKQLMDKKFGNKAVLFEFLNTFAR